MNANTYDIEAAAARALFLYSPAKLPISAVEIAMNMGIKIINKKDAAEICEILEIEESVRQMPAFALHLDNTYIIVVDIDNTTVQERKFMIAHEIGHVLLGYGQDDEDTLRIEKAFGRHPKEISCDIFAYNLLIPRIVVRAMGITDTRSIVETCDVVETIAFMAENHFMKSHTFAQATDHEVRLWIKFKPFIKEYTQQEKMKQAISRTKRDSRTCNQTLIWENSREFTF